MTNGNQAYPAHTIIYKGEPDGLLLRVIFDDLECSISVFDHRNCFKSAGSCIYTFICILNDYCTSIIKEKTDKNEYYCLLTIYRRRHLQTYVMFALTFCCNIHQSDE